MLDILAGYNATIFAYGQTSAGKTFTMMNLNNTKKKVATTPNSPSTTTLSTGQSNADKRGLGPRIIGEIFNAIDHASDNLEFTVKVSFFEIYMERVNDLLERTSFNNSFTFYSNLNTMN